MSQANERFPPVRRGDDLLALQRQDVLDRQAEVLVVVHHQELAAENHRPEGADVARSAAIPWGAYGEARTRTCSASAKQARRGKLVPHRVDGALSARRDDWGWWRATERYPEQRLQ